MKPNIRRRTRARSFWIVLALLGGLASSSPARAFVTLQNDSWQSGQQAGFQSGFVAGEEGAATLGPVSEGMLLHTVQFLFGGHTSAASVTIRIYEELGTSDPGPLLHQETIFITGSDQILQELDVVLPQIYIPTGGSVRISFLFVYGGLPSIARDSDGSIQTGRNWIHAFGIGWVDAQYLGLTGDFIIRALTLPSTGPGPDAGVDGGVSADGGVLADGSIEEDGGTDPDSDGGAPDGGATPDGATPDGGADPDAGAPPDGGAALDAGGMTGECFESTDCEGGYACLRGACLQMCISQDECPEGTLCHQGVCVDRCEDSSECAGGEVCENAVCVAHCTADDECLAGEECTDYRCRILYPRKDGCGCGAAPGLRNIALPVLLLLAVLLLLIRRRRAQD